MNTLRRYRTNHELRIEYGESYGVELDVWQVGSLLEYCEKSKIYPYEACEYILQKVAQNWGKFKYEFLHQQEYLPGEYLKNLQYSFLKDEDIEFSKNNYKKLVDFYNDIINEYTEDELSKLFNKNMLPKIKIKARAVHVIEHTPFLELLEKNKDKQKSL